MKDRVLLAVTVVSLALSGCGGGSGSTITPPPPPLPTHNVWTWMGGSNLVNQSATYGTPGKAAASNNPGARSAAVNRVDASGTLWLFGGANSSGNALNDLWKYSGGEWTWMSGSNGRINQASMAPWVSVVRTTFRAPAPVPALGSIRPGLYGCSEEWGLIPQVRPGTSTTCGNTARAYGHG